jgi:hypothetical protein
MSVSGLGGGHPGRRRSDAGGGDGAWRRRVEVAGASDGSAATSGGVSRLPVIGPARGRAGDPRGAAIASSLAGQGAGADAGDASGLPFSTT